MFGDTNLLLDQYGDASQVEARDCVWQSKSKQPLNHRIAGFPTLHSAHTTKEESQLARLGSRCLAAACCGAPCSPVHVKPIHTSSQHTCLHRSSMEHLAALNWPSLDLFGACCGFEQSTIPGRTSSHCCSWLCNGCQPQVPTCCIQRRGSQSLIIGEATTCSNITPSNEQLRHSAQSSCSSKRCIHDLESTSNCCRRGGAIVEISEVRLRSSGMPYDAGLTVSSAVTSDGTESDHCFSAQENTEDCATTIDPDANGFMLPSCSPTPSWYSESSFEADLAEWLDSLTQDAATSSACLAPLAVPCNSESVQSQAIIGKDQQDATHSSQIQGILEPQPLDSSAFSVAIETASSQDSQPNQEGNGQEDKRKNFVGSAPAPAPASGTPNTSTRPRKRRRARYDQVRRIFACPFPGCTKSYGKLQHLNTHLAYMKHGDRQSLEQYRAGARLKAKAANGSDHLYSNLQ